MNYILQLQNINKSFGDHKVLDNISVSVPTGSIYGFLGPNGAGKTTTIRIINQIIYPDYGNIIFNNEKLNRSHIGFLGYLPEERGLYPKMTVGEHLIYIAQLKGFKSLNLKNTIKDILEEFEITGWWNKKIEQLSKGMQQKLQFIISVMHQPSLVILDEPFSGFDPVNAELVKKKILELNKKGMTFILSTHRMESVEELCDFMMMINKSKKVIDGDISEIKQKYKTNQFKITCKGEINIGIFPDEIKNKIVFEQISGLESSILLTVSEQIKVNDVIKQLLEKTEIISVNEIIPSIHDIFIRLVKDKQ